MVKFKGWNYIYSFIYLCLVLYLLFGLIFVFFIVSCFGLVYENVWFMGYLFKLVDDCFLMFGFRYGLYLLLK